jgi:predicted O-methyltransferase YrrM
MNDPLGAYLDDLPRLHTWDLGVTWNTGGFYPSQLRRMHRIVRERFGDGARILETGAGNSTITFLYGCPKQLVAIAPSADLRDRILAYCADHEIESSPLDFRVERSEIELPAIALATDAPVFDVVLLDGGHGWPTVFVDFCYCNSMMRAGSLLLLDDTQLHSVAELSRLLERQTGFTFKEALGKLQVWEKDDDQRFLPEHSREPYLIEMTKRAERKPRARLDRTVIRAKRIVARFVPPGRLGRRPAPSSWDEPQVGTGR